jgi:hypothetical protein
MPEAVPTRTSFYAGGHHRRCPAKHPIHVPTSTSSRCGPGNGGLEPERRGDVALIDGLPVSGLSPFPDHVPGYEAKFGFHPPLYGRSSELCEGNYVHRNDSYLSRFFEHHARRLLVRSLVLDKFGETNHR